MPRRRPKIPLATAAGPRPEASIKTAEWKRIERAYGRALPLPARRAALRTTGEYLGVAMFEPTAEPIRDTAKRLKQVQRGALLLMQALAKCDEASAAAVYATRLIERHATDPLLPKHEKVRFYPVADEWHSRCFRKGSGGFKRGRHEGPLQARRALGLLDTAADRNSARTRPAMGRAEGFRQADP
jgi:hypothetical protein